MNDTYVATVFIRKNGVEIKDFHGELEQIYIQTETSESSDGVIVLNTPTGRKRISLVMVVEEE